MALHWGWPNDVAVKGGGNYGYTGAKPVYDFTKATYERYKEICGEDKPMVMSEHNADGDVTGPYEQAKIIREFCDTVKDDNALWLDGFTLYQFRDRGRLGLEWEDPNNPEVGIELPLLREYKKIIHEDWFKPSMEKGGEATLPVNLRWGGSEDAEGLSIPLNSRLTPCSASCSSTRTTTPTLCLKSTADGSTSRLRANM